MKPTIVTSLLLLILTISNLTIITSNSQNYTRTDYWQRYPELERIYKSSQYVNKNPEGWIPDEALYAYAGGWYIQGNNPVLVNVEAPPFGKYVIGLSANIFGNENTLIMLGFGLLSILGIIVLGKQILGSLQLALLPPLLLSFEPLYRNQFKYVPHFDIAHMALLLWTFIFFNKARENNQIKWWILTSLTLGFFISTKFFMSGAPVLAAIFLTLVINKQWAYLFRFSLTLPVAVLTLLSMYIRVFAFGYSIKEFLGIQKYIYLFWQHKFELPFSIWPLIYLNQWYVWWGEKPILQESQWRLSWPVTITTSLTGALCWIVGKIQITSKAQILLAFTLSYLGFLSFGQTTARYLVILQPITYILSVYFFAQLFQKYRYNQNNQAFKN